MIQKQTRLCVADNTGAKEAMCIGHLKNRTVARIGDIITVSIKSTYANSSIKRKQIAKAIIIRSKSGFNRGNVKIRFNDNAIVLLDSNCKKILGNRINGASIYEIKNYSLEVFKLLKKLY